MFVEQPAHPAQGQTEQPHQNTGQRARKIQPDVGELAAPAIAEHLDGLVRQSREQTAQDRPRDVNEKVPGIDPQAESEQEAFQRILAEMCQLAHDVVCQMVRHAGHSQTGEHLFIRSNTRPLADSETSPICMELEKMKTMQAMSAKVKMTRAAMSQGEVFCISGPVSRISPGP